MISKGTACQTRFLHPDPRSKPRPPLCSALPYRLHFSAHALPKLRHLRLSCSGQLLTLHPYQSLNIQLPTLEALEVDQVAVWSHVDLTTIVVGAGLTASVMRVTHG